MLTIPGTAAQLLAQPNTTPPTAPPPPTDQTPGQKDELRETFHTFVGETFYSHLLSAMRKTVKPPAYLHGGRAEEVFQGQLDQLLSQHLTEASAEQFAEPMFQLFQLNSR